MFQFDPPAFRPHPLWRGGHLQTIAPSRFRPRQALTPQALPVTVSEGDQIVLHIDQPPSWTVDQPTVMLIHGLTGCHGAPYMVRLADHFLTAGFRVCRMDMRGFGAAWGLSRNLSHAGRSDDVLAGLSAIMERDAVGSEAIPTGVEPKDAGEKDAEPKDTGLKDTEQKDTGHTEADQVPGQTSPPPVRRSGQSGGPVFAVGISLGGAQLLRAVGRIGKGLDARPVWFDRLAAIAAVSPPLDLARCSKHMERMAARLYNRYFIRSLFDRAPKQVKEREDFQAILRSKRPRTLFELDNRVTAPLSGFSDALDYYQQSSPHHTIAGISIPTLVVAAKDDPIVPYDCFADANQQWSPSTCLVTTLSGGHVGFVEHRGTPGWGDRRWLDETLEMFFAQNMA